MQKFRDSLFNGTLRILKKLISPLIETDNIYISNTINGISVNDYMTAHNMDNYYNKNEIDEQMGDIETILSTIVEV